VPETSKPGSLIVTRNEWSPTDYELDRNHRRVACSPGIVQTINRRRVYVKMFRNQQMAKAAAFP
jgi:hypothetical protein